MTGLKPSASSSTMSLMSFLTRRGSSMALPPTDLKEGFVPVGLEVGKRADDDGCLFNQAGDFGVHISNATVEMIDAERGKFKAGVCF